MSDIEGDCTISYKSLLQIINDLKEERHHDVRRYMQRESVSLAQQALGGEIALEELETRLRANHSVLDRLMAGRTAYILAHNKVTNLSKASAKANGNGHRALEKVNGCSERLHE